MNLISARMRRENGRFFVLLGDTSTKIGLKKDMEPNGGSEQEITVGIRAEHIHFSDAGSPSCLSGRISAIEPLGREFLLHVRTDAGTILVLSPEKRFKPGAAAEIGFAPDRIHLFFEGRSNENGI